MAPLMTSRLQSFKYLLGFFLGIAVTLFVVLVGDGLFSQSYGFPFGWVALWLISTIGAVPLGIVMLIGRSWRSFPLSERGGPAMGYLMVGFINTLGMAVRTAFDYPGPGLRYLVVIYAMVLFVVYAATRPERVPKEEEMFP
jgi:hypothetical protein